MNKSIICSNVSKRFLGKSSKRFLLLYLLNRLFNNSLFKFKFSYAESVNVLNNVTFQLSYNNFLGLIGANGAGKSTLLQILTGTMQPSSGTVLTSGRVCSLLELGSGFNPEFTGIENVKLGCSLVNLPTGQSSSIINEILDFSEIGHFADQPIKFLFFRNGNRLAFSVLVFSNPDILIIDEALAVGDISFAQKCISYLQDFRQNGILIISSHDLSQIKVLCDQCIWLHQGQVREIGPTKRVTENYQTYMLENVGNLNPNGRIKLESTQKEDVSNVNLTELKKAELLKVELINTSSGKLIKRILKNEYFDAYLDVLLSFEEKIENPILGFYVRNTLGLNLLDLTLELITDRLIKPKWVKNYRLDLILKMPILEEGEYTITIALSDGTQQNHKVIFWVHNAYQFQSTCKTPTGLVGVEIDQVSYKNIEI